jgi:hypothetical protein
MKIILGKTFPGPGALAAAAKWLAEQCGSDWRPALVVAKGNDARLVLSGPEGGCIVLVKP